MNWIFYDPQHWDYDVAAPLTRPMGGSQSAMCYLAMALARRGSDVTTLTRIPARRTVNGVTCLPHQDASTALFSKEHTVAVVLGGPAEFIQEIRQFTPTGLPVVLWMQGAYDQQIVEALRNPDCARQWTRIVCVSDWQRRTAHEHLGVPLDQMEVLRNAIAPAYEGLFQNEDELFQAKSVSLRLAYTSTPFRGLDVLVNCFPDIRQRHPSCRLSVYSSMLVYGDSKSNDMFRPLYAMCRLTDGSDYQGSIAQPDLAKEMRGVSILAYPCTFAETSCIAAMEAMAAGALVVTVDLGAL